jgi:hypothetical protein
MQLFKLEVNKDIYCLCTSYRKMGTKCKKEKHGHSKKILICLVFEYSGDILTILNLQTFSNPNFHKSIFGMILQNFFFFLNFLLISVT